MAEVEAGDKVVQDIWEEILGVPVTDELDFFDAGGDSFDAAAMTARVNSRLKLRIPITVGLYHPRFRDFLQQLNKFLQD